MEEKEASLKLYEQRILHLQKEIAGAQSVVDSKDKQNLTLQNTISSLKEKLEAATNLVDAYEKEVSSSTIAKVKNLDPETKIATPHDEVKVMATELGKFTL